MAVHLYMTKVNKGYLFLPPHSTVEVKREFRKEVCTDEGSDSHFSELKSQTTEFSFWKPEIEELRSG